MARKSNRPRSGAASSSYDRNRFWSAEAEKTYEKYLRRSLLQERDVDLKRVSRLRIEGERRRWLELMREPAEGVCAVVREFYSNLKVRHDDFKVLVRGKMMAFDRTTINRLYKLPQIDDDEYHALINDYFDCETIIETLTTGGAEWHMRGIEHVWFMTKYLTVDNFLWWKFMCGKIVPSGQHSTITRDKTVLLYAIATGMTIDIGLVIQSHILNTVRETNSGGLPYPGLITELCGLAGVQWGEEEERIRPQGLLDTRIKMTARERAAVPQLAAGPFASTRIQIITHVGKQLIGHSCCSPSEYYFQQPSYLSFCLLFN